ncbi:aldolase/citrate lyase family protein [Mycetocola sp. 2940]|uniref:HpcH/HpaI aldolase family protein n=1 Tax=Mycetocola sp. 2940 TaxID=3156452 RepID=UPI00339918DD
MPAYLPADIRVGTMISEFVNPSMPRILDAAGFEFAILDCEHGAFDMETVGAMANVASGTALDLWVRTPAISREYIGRYLDAGIVGIVAPMVDTVEQAEALVRMTKYPPLGSRGISVTRAHSGYVVDDLPAYLSSANERVQVYAQIETARAVDGVEAIAAVDGLDGLIVGPNDLLGDLGFAGQLDHPSLRSAVERVADAARSSGKRSGIITGDLDLITIAVERGADIVSVNSDVGYLLRAARNQLHDLGRGRGHLTGPHGVPLTVTVG